MNRRLDIAVLSLALCCASSAPTIARAADAPAPSRARIERAGELYRQANKLYDEKKLAAAETLYRQAWEIQKTYDIASNLGAIELDLGKPAAAAEHLAFALRQFPARGKLATHAALTARLEKAKKLSCTLRVKAATGARIFIDGREVGAAPLAEEVFVDAGAHVLEARLDGHRDAKQTIRVAAGFEQDVTLSLVALPASPKRSLVPGIVLGAAGAAALGVGGVLIGLAESNRADAQALSDRLKASKVSCAAPSASCAELHGLTARTDALGNAGIGALVGGGALAAGALVYVLWPSARPTSKTKDTALRASFDASPTGGGVTVLGSF